jgi:hypothetical protein
MLGQLKNELKLRAESKDDEFIDYSCFTKSDRHLMAPLDEDLQTGSQDSGTDF